MTDSEKIAKIEALMPFEDALTVLEHHVIEQKMRDTEEGHGFKDVTIAQVIFAECGDICSRKEMWLVASVMSNRIRNPGFGCGKLASMHDVAYQPGAFSCINDPKNSNWAYAKAYADNDSNIFNADVKNPNWQFAVRLSRGSFIPCPHIVYYHDKSISKPKSWDNKYYTTFVELETKHFIFYSIKETDNT